MVRAKRNQETLGTTLGLEIGSSEWEMGRNGSRNLKQKSLREEMRTVWRGLPEKSRTFVQVHGDSAERDPGE